MGALYFPYSTLETAGMVYEKYSTLVYWHYSHALCIQNQSIKEVTYARYLINIDLKTNM